MKLLDTNDQKLTIEFNRHELIALIKACDEAGEYMDFCLNNYDDYSPEELDRVKGQLADFEAMYKRLATFLWPNGGVAV